MSAINDLARLILAQMTQTDVDRRTQAQIDGCMRGAVSDVRRGNPNQLMPLAPSMKPTATQWVGEKPLPYLEKGSHMDRLVDAMVEKHVGGPNTEKR